jgi:hypothetical protein
MIENKEEKNHPQIIIISLFMCDMIFHYWQFGEGESFSMHLAIYLYEKNNNIHLILWNALSKWLSFISGFLTFVR